MNKIKLHANLHLYTCGITLQLESIALNINRLKDLIRDNNIDIDFDNFLKDYKGSISKMVQIDKKLLSMDI